MARWLAKQEPTSYAFRDLVRERTTEWDGVHNALALRHLRSMRRGEEVLFYASGDQRAVVGTMRIVSAPHPDPHDTRGSWSVKVRAGRALERPVTLREIRTDPTFTDFDLLRNTRLSVLPVPDTMWSRILELARTPSPAGPDGVPSPNRRSRPRRPGKGSGRLRAGGSRRGVAHPSPVSGG
ncbi:MAG: EVE domain-containing protein [Thermoplasmata archaeon]